MQTAPRQVSAKTGDISHVPGVLPTSYTPLLVGDDVPHDNEQPVRSGKRKHNVSNWKINIDRLLRLQGKSCTDSCVFRGKSCTDSYVFRVSRVQTPASSGCISPPQRKRHKSSASNQKKRSISYKHFVCTEGKITSVCQQTLASIVSVKIAPINYKCELVSKGYPGPDKRGNNHLRPNRISANAKQPVHDFLTCIPIHVSHDTRKQIPRRQYLPPELNEKKLYDLYITFVAEIAIQPVTFRTFRKLFVTEFNLHFGHPRLDTCKTLIWTYKLGVHDINGGSVHMWHEDIASRGSQDKASCLIAYSRSEKESIKGRKALEACSLMGTLVNGKKSISIYVERGGLCRNFFCSTTQEEHLMQQKSVIHRSSASAFLLNSASIMRVCRVQHHPLKGCDLQILKQAPHTTGCGK
ncbi:hypothetical protein PR048_024517 [Dryococelus australis]|uniref:Uncharacterized protein n=1 Tax=Dryococelus australis TaxID=614101 RepID=A0ABQ9GNU6_9NEOP|nr:hypothetical protein PR048_024517 [Dryococelus australis]